MTWLEFADPTRFWWGLLAIPIIALFILRVRLRRRRVSTLLFWEQLLDEQPPRKWWPDIIKSFPSPNKNWMFCFT